MPNSRLALLSDVLGSIIAQQDAGTGALSPFGYHPYGYSSSPPAQFGYTGQRLDPETGLYYYRARHYSPVLGRFLQPDPLGYAAGSHLYAFVLNDPTNGIDSFGTLNCGGPWQADCGSVDAAMSPISQMTSSSRISPQQQMQLSKLYTLLSSNNVNVMLKNMPPIYAVSATVVNNMGIISINVPNLPRMDDNTIPPMALAAIIVHEGTHVRDLIEMKISVPRTELQQTILENNAYGMEQTFFQVIGAYRSELWNPNWSLPANQSDVDAAGKAAAQGSIDLWLQTKGSSPATIQPQSGTK